MNLIMNILDNLDSASNEIKKGKIFLITNSNQIISSLTENMTAYNMTFII